MSALTGSSRGMDSREHYGRMSRLALPREATRLEGEVAILGSSAGLSGLLSAVAASFRRGG